MPIYDYQCVCCGGRDQRLAGCDDHIAICDHCGSLMLRDEDVLWPYFEVFDTACESIRWPKLQNNFDVFKEKDLT
jgi:hypothetical protein